MNFNSRAHVERDEVAGMAEPVSVEISTHALTWSATPFTLRALKDMEISTHALTWSATRYAVIDKIGQSNFNSRAHVERDGRGLPGRGLHRNFNSRAHVERDTWNGINTEPRKSFQLTRSRGARLQSSGEMVDAVHFNSRAHVERDSFRGPIYHHFDHFNSRAHVERDMDFCEQNANFAHFNSRAHVERDSSPSASVSVSAISTHALTWSATRGLKT